MLAALFMWLKTLGDFPVNLVVQRRDLLFDSLNSLGQIWLNGLVRWCAALSLGGLVFALVQGANDPDHE